MTTPATAAAGDDGGGDGEGSIWVLLPDTASSERWEADDRRYFTQFFEEAGLSRGRRLHDRERGRRRVDATGPGRAGDRRRRQRHPADEPRHGLGRDDHRQREGRRRRRRRVRPVQHRWFRRGGVRQLRQRAGRSDDGRAHGARGRRRSPPTAPGRHAERWRGGQQLVPVPRRLRRDRRSRRSKKATGASSPTNTSRNGTTRKRRRSWSRSSWTPATTSTQCSPPTTGSPKRRSTHCRPPGSGPSRSVARTRPRPGSRTSSSACRP